jgi:hypothetical protein
MTGAAKAFAAIAASCLLLALGGCGDGGSANAGTEEGTIYVAASLCQEAKTGLAQQRELVGQRRLRVRCLPAARDPENVEGIDLAALGAGARRVTEDSTAIAYSESAGPANKYVPPIVESAGIAITYTSSGELAISRILHAIQRAGDFDGSLREAVADQMQGLFPDED